MASAAVMIQMKRLRTAAITINVVETAGLVKPNQCNVDQDGQKKEGGIHEKDPAVSVFVDGRKIFRADKLPGTSSSQCLEPLRRQTSRSSGKSRGWSEVLVSALPNSWQVQSHPTVRIRVPQTILAPGKRRNRKSEFRDRDR